MNSINTNNNAACNEIEVVGEETNLGSEDTKDLSQPGPPQPGPPQPGPPDSLYKFNEAVCTSHPSKKQRVVKKRTAADALLEDRRDYNKKRIEMERERQKERDRRQALMLETNLALLQALNKNYEVHQGIANKLTELTEIFRKYTEYWMSLPVLGASQDCAQH